jgi:hypothetical protein
MSEEQLTIPGEETLAPKPSDLAKPEPEPQEPEKPSLSAEQLQAELAKVRKEAAGYRTKLREAEPLVKKAQEAEEANKTEVQRALERAEAAEKINADLQVGYTRMEIAAARNIPPDLIDFLGSGSREEMEERAERLLTRIPSTSTPPPPSNRPVEGLRPGASPEPPTQADNSYPAEWGFTPPRST